MNDTARAALQFALHEARGDWRDAEQRLSDLRKQIADAELQASLAAQRVDDLCEALGYVVQDRKAA